MERRQNLSVGEPISYEGESENARYSVTVMPSSGEVRGGMIVALPSDEVGGDNSNALAYYSGSDLLALSISHQDVAALAEYYQSDRSGDPPDVYTFRTYHAPFAEAFSQRENGDEEHVFMKEGRVIYRKSDVLEDGASQKMTHIEFPYHIEGDITSLLHREVEHVSVADNEHSSELPQEEKKINEEDIPPKYRTFFYTSVAPYNSTK